MASPASLKGMAPPRMQMVAMAALVLITSVRGGTYVNCGGESFTSGAVTWSADTLSVSSGTIFTTAGNVTVETGTEPASSRVYQSARIFDGRAGPVNSYSIPVPTLQYYWVRLYFAEILQRDPKMRTFDVSIEGAAVLEQFSVEGVMQGLRKEFLIPVSDGSLDISFIRGSAGDPMISGIEVVPAPVGMYALDAKAGPALATRHRLSCGANATLADSLSRVWVPDEGLFEPAAPSSAVYDLVFRKALPDGMVLRAASADMEPDYHPSEVYKIMRTTVNGFENETSSTLPAAPLTYTLQAAPSQPHLVRIGFAELLLPWNSSRLLNISIDGRQLVSLLDVVRETGYLEPHVENLNVVSNAAGSLTITISSGAFLGYTRDAFVNSLEVLQVYKTNMSIQNALLGVKTSKKDVTLQGVWMGAASGTAFFAIVIASLFFISSSRLRAAEKDSFPFSLKGKKSRHDPSEALLENFFYNRDSGLLPSETTYTLLSKLYGTRIYSSEELNGVTGHFSPESIVRTSPFGTVYRGVEGGGGTAVAVTRWETPKTPKSEYEFLVNVNLLAHLHHRHLLNLVGYCDDGDQLALVHEFASKGSLCDYLQDPSKAAELGWEHRLQIAIGAARALEYLHNGTAPTAVHGSFTACSVLLDDSMEAKVADFGQSALRRRQERDQCVTEKCGWYLDPSCYPSSSLSQEEVTEEASDVLGFGVVLLALVTGRPPLWSSPEEEEESDVSNGSSSSRTVRLAEWVAERWERADVKAIAAPELALAHSFSSVQHCVKVALCCVSELASQRLNMRQVLRELERAQKLLERGFMETLSSVAPVLETSGEYEEGAEVGPTLHAFPPTSLWEGRGREADERANIVPPLVTELMHAHSVHGTRRS